MEMESIPCPLCSAEEHDFFHEEKGFRYVSCRACGLVRLNPRPTAAALHEHYQSYLPSTPERVERWRASMMPLFRRSGRLVETLAPERGRLLDVGTGFGFFPAWMRGRGWDAAGLEISADGASHAESLGVPVLRTPLEEAGLEPASFDAVTAFYVIEHLPDPRGACRAMARILRPGGVLLLRWPHSAPLVRWTARLGLELGLLHAPSHLCQFSPASMEALLRGQGFEAVRTRVGGWTWPASALWRAAGVGGGALARALEALTAGRLLLPGVSKTTVALRKGGQR